MIQAISTPALDRALSFAQAESDSHPTLSSTNQPSDLPFDGRPRLRLLRSDADGCALQTYHWPRAYNSQEPTARGVVFLLHGVRAHLRLTWLAKRPPHLIERPTPLNHILMEQGAIEDDTWCDIDDSASGESDLSQFDATAATYTAGLVTSRGRRALIEGGSRIASKVMQSVSVGCQKTFAEASPDERETQVFYEGSWIEGLNAAGYDVYGMDLRGHGRSGGERCTINDFELYCADVMTVIEQVVWGSCSVAERGGRPKLIVLGVSLSTLILCKILQKPAARNLHIHACALFSGFLKEGAKYSTRPIKTFLKLLVKVRHFLPNVPLVLPKKPETHGPSWQLRYGEQDPYLCKRAFTVRMVGTCVAALQEFDDTKALLASAGVCKHVKMFHNYYDMVNPVDGSLEVYSWLMAHCKDLDFQCTIFNSIDMEADQAKLWHPDVVFDNKPVDLGHTLITDTDNLYVFTHFFKWLVNL